MIIGEPAPTQADVHFRLFGFPVRVHPFFWLGTLLLGASGEAEPVGVLIWVAVVFVSILVHELGHTCMQRHYGGRPWIVLHGFGGLAICGDCDRSPRSQILISLAGPAAGFLLAALVVIVVRLAGHRIGVTVLGIELVLSPTGSRFGPLGQLVLFDADFHLDAGLLNVMIWDLLVVNILWGLVNLLPIYPLDGGQVARELFTLRNPRRGIVLSLQLSIVMAGLVAAYALSQKSTITCLMFAFLAYGSYQALRAYQDHYA